MDETLAAGKRHTPSKSGGGKPHSSIGERCLRIEGSYRPITVHQLSLAWWLHAAGHLTRRQLRVYFALHEMAERRRYAEDGRQALYRLDEVLHLVGGRDSRERGSGGEARARSELSGDLRRLARLGLATLSDHHIEFATSADQIRLGGSGGGVDDLSGFWTMFEQIPNRRRTVPVPRRMVRALAAGFSRATTALVLALLIRGLFWHRGTGGSGGGVSGGRGRGGATGTYRTDGRYKLSWVAHVFGVSRRAVSDARTTLIDLGWIEPLEVGQVMMNRFGLHDRIVPEWKHPDTSETPSNTPDEAVGEGADSDARDHAGSACPNGDFHAGSACPDLTDSLPLTGNQYTRNPAPTRAGPAGVSTGSTWRSDGEPSESSRPNRGSGSRGGKRRGASSGPPNIRDIQPADLASTDRLLELHRQACGIGIASPSEHGRLEFLAFAERARTRGDRAGAMFFWFLRERPTAFITLSDEDRAAQRLREHLNGPSKRQADRERWGGDGAGGRQPRPEPEPFSEQEQTVLACIRVAKQHRLDPALVAQKAKGWARQVWDEAYDAFQRAQFERQNAMVGEAEG